MGGGARAGWAPLCRSQGCPAPDSHQPWLRKRKLGEQPQVGPPQRCNPDPPGVRPGDHCCAGEHAHPQPTTLGISPNADCRYFGTSLDADLKYGILSDCGHGCCAMAAAPHCGGGHGGGWLGTRHRCKVVIMGFLDIPSAHAPVSTTTCSSQNTNADLNATGGAT